MNSRHRYIIFGPQGSGKGTQAEFLAAELGVPHIATGNLFREEVARGTVLGKRIATDMEAGKLMSNEDTNVLLSAELKRSGGEGHILDGYPRTLAQAEYLAALAPPTKAILLEFEDDEAIRRISGRRHCSKGDHVYHLIFNPPQKPGVCDVCGGSLFTRADDQEESIRTRLKTYHELTEPLVDYYEAKKKLVRIPAAGSIEEVKKAIRKALGFSDEK